MYILKDGPFYFDGYTFVTSQKDAKRFAMDRPTSTFNAYLGLLFDSVDVRFVKLTRKSDGFYGSDAPDNGYSDSDWGF